jgi:hypothetical protein
MAYSHGVGAAVGGWGEEGLELRSDLLRRVLVLQRTVYEERPASCSAAFLDDPLQLLVVNVGAVCSAEGIQHSFWCARGWTLRHTEATADSHVPFTPYAGWSVLYRSTPTPPKIYHQSSVSGAGGGGSLLVLVGEGRWQTAGQTGRCGEA